MCVRVSACDRNECEEKETERRAGVGDIDPMAPAWQPPDKVMKELKNERPQLDDAIMGMMVGR